MNPPNETSQFCWLNGTFQQENAAQLSATSAACLLGWGVFTTVGVFAGTPFALPLHLARLRSDAQKTQLTLPFSDVEITSAVEEVLVRNEVREGLARLTLLRRADARWNTEIGCDFLIAARENSAASTRGKAPCRVMLSSHRINARRPTCGLKTTSYLDSLMAWQQAQNLGFDETLLLNTEEKICEGGRSNVFWARDGEVFTASQECGPLPGIGRALLLQWLREENTSCREGAFVREELLRADAMWLVSAASGVREVAQLHDFSGEYSRGKEKLLRRFDAGCSIIAMLQSKWHKATRSSENNSF